jgi:hypothetical protein
MATEKFHFKSWVICLHSPLFQLMKFQELKLHLPEKATKVTALFKINYVHSVDKNTHKGIVI